MAEKMEKLEEKVEKITRDLDKANDQIEEQNSIINQLNREVALVEGGDLESMPSPELRKLIARYKKVIQKTNAILLKRLEDDTLALKRAVECSLCATNKIDTLFLPCGHVRTMP
jgi:hypothetical protein